MESTSVSASQDISWEIIPRQTSFAQTKAEEESFEAFPFEKKEKDDPAIMLEIPAGSLNYYQCYITGESLNELEIRIPGPFNVRNRTERLM